MRNANGMYRLYGTQRIPTDETVESVSPTLTTLNTRCGRVESGSLRLALPLAYQCVSAPSIGHGL